MTRSNKREFIDQRAASAAAVHVDQVRQTSVAAREPLWFVDPELRPAAQQIIQRSAAFPGYSKETLPIARQAMSALAQPPLPGIAYEKRQISGGRNGPDVTVYIVNGKPDARRPGILHTHGGGFIVGSAADYLRLVQEVASALDCVVVSVDYRLAPETTWRGSLEDNYTGLRWLYDHADEVGADRERLAVMGESAGGGHAALLAITARDRGEIPLVFQCLTYPMLDDRTGTTRVVREPTGTIGWNAASNKYGWASFLGRVPGRRSGPAEGVPARTADVSGLPAAWIGVGSNDLFVGEDLEYARRLIEANVSTELLVVPAAFHGFDLVAPETSLARCFKSAKIAALQRALAA